MTCAKCGHPIEMTSVGRYGTRDRAMDVERFFLAIDFTPGCWTWKGAHSRGYGQVWWMGKFVYAHRLMYELAVGPIPDGLELDHLCRVRLCVNPRHLEPVKHSVNVRRGESLAAFYAARTHCDRGHELSGDNILVRRDGGGRRCRLCRRLYQERRRIAERVR